MMDGMWWIVVVAGIVLVGAFILAAARRKGPNVEGAFVDSELEAEAEAEDCAAGVPIDVRHPGASVAEARAAAGGATLDSGLDDDPDANAADAIIQSIGGFVHNVEDRIGKTIAEQAETVSDLGAKAKGLLPGRGSNPNGQPPAG